MLIDYIWTMLLMHALLDDEGDHVSFKDLKESFLKFATVLQDMQNYDRNNKKATPKQEPTAPAGPTLLSASILAFSPSPMLSRTFCSPSKLLLRSLSSTPTEQLFMQFMSVLHDLEIFYYSYHSHRNLRYSIPGATVLPFLIPH